MLIFLFKIAVTVSYIQECTVFIWTDVRVVKYTPGSINQLRRKSFTSLSEALVCSPRLLPPRGTQTPGFYINKSLIFLEGPPQLHKFLQNMLFNFAYYFTLYYLNLLGTLNFIVSLLLRYILVNSCSYSSFILNWCIESHYIKTPGNKHSWSEWIHE